jgi:hypothetical protein
MLGEDALDIVTEGNGSTAPPLQGRGSETWRLAA